MTANLKRKKTREAIVGIIKSICPFCKHDKARTYLSRDSIRCSKCKRLYEVKK